MCCKCSSTECSFIKYNSIKWFNFSQYKMAQYNSLNEELSSSQFNKFKSAINNETEVILRLSSNIISNFHDKINFPPELLLTDRQATNLCKAFVNYLSTDVMLSKTNLSKMIKSGGFLDRILGILLKTRLPLMENIVKLIAKIVLIQLGLTLAASSGDAGIHKKI